MKEKQVFQRHLVLWVLLAAVIHLVSCQAQQASIAFLPGWSITRTFTPFQPHSPTPKPTVTPTSTPQPTSTFQPTSSPQPTNTAIICQSETGSIERMQILFQEQPVVFRLYLPACYGEANEIRYPVLYLIHGQTYRDDQWDRLGIDEAADALISAKQAPPFIIVMPLEANTFEDIFVSPFSSGLIDGLIPWMDANYSTCAERACRAIGGLSRGGAWALRLGFTNWELFGSVGLHSTPPFIGDPDRFPAWLRAIPTDQVPRVYMDTGNRDWFIDSTREFEEILVQQGVPHEWYLFNGTHNEEYWSSHTTDYLAWYTQPWQELIP